MIRLRKLAAITGIASTFFLQNMFCATMESEYNYVEIAQYNANNPIEDRYTYTKLKSIKGFTASVFDGHGGDLVVRDHLFRQSMLRRILMHA